MRADQPPLTLGTAGHIDHGKTALVAALTGVDTDRLAAEKARGISIELGYAPLELPSGRRMSVVDVPGHERFVRTMVAGATGIDLALLVIACDDGVMPQTREHVAILELLRIPAAVVALTKRDTVDGEAAELARLDAEELLERGPYAQADVIEVSARTGDGLDELRRAIDTAAAASDARAGEGTVRLPIDRSFSLRGIGTVVTGTLWSGSVTAGDRLAVEPGGRPVRVRSVQVHDRPVESAAAGQRVAVALVGAERRHAGRGHVLATPGSLTASFRLDCDLEVLASAPRELRTGEQVTVHHGTAELPARLAVRGDPVAPGGSGRVQLRLRRRVAALEGDRVIVRLTAPQVTVAGGAVVDPAPTRSSRPRPQAAAPRPAAAPARPSAAGAHELLARLAASPLAPPPLSAADQEAAAHLAGEGRIVRSGRDLAFTVEAFDRAREAVVELAGGSGSVTIAQLRDRLGISRRYAQGLLEAMDAAGVTRRVGDERVLRRRGRDLAAGARGGDAPAQ